MIPRSPGKTTSRGGGRFDHPGARGVQRAGGPADRTGAGYDAVYLSGAAFSAGTLALPDIGLFTLTELAQQTAYLTRRVKIPVIVDADTGFGEAVNVERTIVELEAAGAAAIQLEDQLLPKRCGHLSGKSLVEPDEMCAKLRAAAAARSDPNLVILARTDARGVDGSRRRDRAGQALSRRRRRLDLSRGAGRRRANSSSSPRRSTRRWWPT